MRSRRVRGPSLQKRFRHALNTPDPLSDTSFRKRISRLYRQTVRETRWALEWRRLRGLENSYRGRRAFLVGNGPSLKSLPLAKLDGEIVCVVNLGLRAVGPLLSHADMYFINDVYCFENYGAEIERDIDRHGVSLRFMNLRLKSRWKALANRAARPFFLLGERSIIRDSGRILPLRHGFTRGATVLISAASVLKFLGFAEVYIIGCDLDYGSSDKYFYEMDTQDVAHENRPEIADRRRDMVFANREFELMRAFYEASGQKLINAGRGGNLNTLERVSFESLFPE
jgi:hypothetical protein